MYCPLCKAEYRAGFDQCSDCHVGLVQTREHAEAASVLLLWKGTQQSRFNAIVGALRDANIPHYARSGAKPERKRPLWTYIGIIRLFFDIRETHDTLSWQIFVLESDYSAARGIAENQV